MTGIQADPALWPQHEAFGFYLRRNSGQIASPPVSAAAFSTIFAQNISVAASGKSGV
jgi:hypothetical protein